VIQGLGYTLSEVLTRRGGRILNPNFTNYNVLSPSDIPEIKVVFIEHDEPGGPFGAKGLGEPGMVCIPAAVGNAIDNALGIRMKELPITPERILSEIKKSQATASFRKH
jgi:xanthine dehydrogenase molybdenum-binding subunit